MRVWRAVLEFFEEQGLVMRADILQHEIQGLFDFPAHRPGDERRVQLGAAIPVRQEQPEPGYAHGLAQIDRYAIHNLVELDVLIRYADDPLGQRLAS